MSNKPPATPPPSHLSARARDIWAAVCPKRVTSPERLALLQAALEAMDRTEQAREILAREGLTSTTKSTGAVHVHPLAKIELEARRQFASLWAQLGLDKTPYGMRPATLADLGVGED